ncbi:MAG: hypothetical protein HUJ98_04485, partial [Bacteroidaceae bacterium]|nr:hypothetical protein [Bacteroidaceae bacterium]
MDTGGKTIYKPVKYQSGTISIITPDYNFDIYNAKAQDTKVELLEGEELVWTGYATPNLYDMGFVEEREEVTESDVLSAKKILELLDNCYGIAADRKSVYADVELLQEYGLDILQKR